MLTQLLIAGFVRDHRHPENPHVRLAYGTLTGVVGIAVNALLFGVKLAIGLLSGSVAMAADAINNLSDAGSAIITLFGFKMASRPADNEHPFGHGRFEYVAGVILSIVIIAVGFNFLKESVMRIFHPGPVVIGTLGIGIFAGTLFFKFWLFIFYRNIGRRINSQVVLAAAFDSLSDLLSSGVVLAAVFASRFTSFPIDGCAGTLVALLLLWGGFGVLRDAIDPLLGVSADRKFADELRKQVLSCPGIKGVHDIIVHSYGPGMYYATAHAEVDRNGDLVSVHDLLENAEVEVGRHMPVRLLLHCDPFNTVDPVAKVWRVRCEEAVLEFDPNFKLYDFRLEETAAGSLLRFHLLVPRQYALTPAEITERLTRPLLKYDGSVKLDIFCVNAYTE